MALYVTKVWGFAKPYHPLLFSKPKYRDDALKDLKEGDQVLLTCTKGNPRANPKEKGRLLGILEPVNVPIEDPWNFIRRNDWVFNDDGKFKWHYGVKIKRAWMLNERPLFREIIKSIDDKRYGRPLGLKLYEITNEKEKNEILDLSKREVKVSRRISKLSEAPTDHSIKNKNSKRGKSEKKGKKRRNSPPPSDTTYSVVRRNKNKGPAYTYCMKIVDANKSAFKIGCTIDYDARENLFNRHALSSVGGIKYKEKLKYEWDTGQQAYDMEQEILNKFSHKLSRQNQEVIEGVPFEEIHKFWKRCSRKLEKNK